MCPRKSSQTGAVVKVRKKTLERACHVLSRMRTTGVWTARIISGWLNENNNCGEPEIPLIAKVTTLIMHAGTNRRIDKAIVFLAADDGVSVDTAETTMPISEFSDIKIKRIPSTTHSATSKARGK